MGNQLLHMIEFHEPSNDFLIFYEWRLSHVRWNLRERYLPFACKKCGKFDPREALEAGFDDNILSKAPKLEAMITRDYQHVVSENCVALLNHIKPRSVQSWQIGKSKWHYIAPTSLQLPDPAVSGELVFWNSKLVRPAFRHENPKRCKICGRYNELQLDFGRIALRDGQRIGGYWGESPSVGCPDIAWVCDDGAAAVIAKAKLAGLKVSKNMYGPTAPGWLELVRRMNDPNSLLRKAIADGSNGEN